VITEDIRTVLLANAPVFALVGEKIYPHHAGQSKTQPYAVIRIPSDEFVRSVDSSSALSKALVEIECVSDDYLGAWNLAEAVRQALSGKQAPIGSITHGAIQHIATLENYYQPNEGGWVGTYSVTVNLECLRRIPALGA
jgi:hypothetical protein